MTELIGRTLGQYHILEEIGRGGMATVYRAEQPSLRRYVALKVLHPHLAGDTTLVVRFQREARTVAHLQHPHIVTIYQVGQQGGYYFIAMEYLTGQPLNEVIRRHPKTTFICPHVGSKAASLDEAADDLEEMPNLCYDISARIPIMGLSKRRSAHSREFLVHYQDRVLFGTDVIYDDTNVPTGMQAQYLCQPGEIPLGDADFRERYVETTATFIQSHLDFLMTEEVQTDPPFKRTTRGYSIFGLGLPKDVCAKILSGNAQRLIAVA